MFPKLTVYSIVVSQLKYLTKYFALISAYILSNRLTITSACSLGDWYESTLCIVIQYRYIANNMNKILSKGVKL